MSFFDSVASLGAQALGNAIGGPLGGMLADKIMDFAVNMVTDLVQQSDLPDAARNMFTTAYDAGFAS